MLKKTFLFLASFLTVMLYAASAWADVAALSYTDPYNTPQTVQAVKQYINPAGPLSLYLTAGLERKVGYVITDASNQTVATAVSGMVTATDTITVLGQTYYGKVLTMPAALDEGSYTLTAQILDSGGQVVGTQSYPLVVDRTPPSAGGIWWHSVYYDNFITANDLVSRDQVYNLFAKEVSDSFGIDRVQFESFNPSDGNVYYSVPGWYNSSAKTAGVGTGQSGSVATGIHFPKMDGLLGLRIIVYDKAGNKTVAQTTVKFNGTDDPPPELIAIYNQNITSEFFPGSGLIGYEVYTPGMTTYANPMKLLYRVLITNWQTYNPDYGLSVRGGSVVYTDAQYVYVCITAPYDSSGMLDGNQYAFASPSRYSAFGIYYNLVLSSAAPQTPVFVGKALNTSDLGWVNLPNDVHDVRRYYNTPVNVTQIKATVQPRDYAQYVKTQQSVTGDCIIPAGETECVLDVNFPPVTPVTIDYHQTCLIIQNEDGSLKSGLSCILLSYDLMPPSITTHTLDRGNKTVTFQVNDPFPTISSNFYRGPLTGWLLAHNTDTGQEVQVGAAITSLDAKNYQANVNYASLPEGNWQFTVWAKDYYQNTGSLSIEAVVLDQTAPQVQFFKDAAVITDHGATDSLGKISFTVSDNLDTSPQVESARLTGGPQNTDVYLAYRQQNGSYVLEYPVLYPSSGQEYTLTVKAKDASGNQKTQLLAFSYVPPSVQLSSSGQGSLNLPALPAAVVHIDGSNALVSEPVTIAGQVLSGVYDLVVTSATGSTATAVVSNVTVAPGEQKTVPAYDFSANSGRLNLSLWSEQPGQANLLVTSLAPNFPVLTAQVNFWQPQVALTADPGWGVQPVIQTQKIGAAVSGAPCQATFDVNEAQAADPINSPKCLVEFTQKPAAYQVKDGLLQGVLGPSDTLEVDYQVSVYNGGQKYVFGSGSHALDKLPITEVSVKATSTAGTQVYRNVQKLQVAVESDGVIPCKLTTSQSRAQQYALSGVVCLLRWTQTPNGLQQTTDDTGALSGILSDLGNQTMSLAVDVYSPAGSLPDAFSRSLTLSSVTPPVPTMDVVSDLYGQKLDEVKFVTSELTQGDFGRIQFTPAITSVNYTLEVEGGDGGLKSYQYWTANPLTFNRTVYAGALTVWQSKGITIRAYYTDLPEVRTEKSLTVMGVPSQRVQARLTGPNETTDTIGVPIKVQVGLPGQGTDISYAPDRDGTWEARIGVIDRQQKFQPVTDYQDVPGGVLETTLQDFPVGFVQLSAQVRLKPPDGSLGYNREINSNNLYTTVLLGAAPQGRLICRSPSGPAPLGTAVALQVDSNSLRVLGDVAWEMSADQGATWQPMTVKTPMQASVNLSTGQYLMRARLSNKITQQTGYTDNLQLIAYRVPQVAVLGPRAVFVGSPVSLTAQVQVDGQVLPPDQVVVEWYNARNAKVQDGPSLSFTSQDPQTLSYRVRARLKEAPDTDISSWRSANAAVQVMPPRAPGGVVIVPNYIEYNTVEAQTYTISAKVVLPVGLDTSQYPVHGEWHLPDGRTVEGLEVSYSPTAQDGAKRQALFEFDAWIEGYQSQTTAVFRRLVPVGTYTWPEFSVEVKTNPAMAPASVTLTAQPVGLEPWQLQKPAYEWQLPAGVEKVRDLDGSRVIMVNFPNPGDFVVSVNVTDARGSTAQATGTVSLADAPGCQVTFNPLYSNALMRELLDVSLRPSVRCGHPLDRLATWLFSVDDPQAQVLGVNENTIFKGLHAGNRDIHLHAVSLLGKVIDVDYSLTVIPNQPPACTISSYDTADSRWFNAICKDPDGRIVATRWFLNDQQISLGQTVRFQHGTPGALRFEAEDDAGAKYNESLNTN